MVNNPRLTGLCLLLMSIGFFFASDLDKRGGVWGLCGFLVCFVGGWLVLIFFWNDGDIPKLRRIWKENPPGRAFQAMPVQERTFRYRPMRGGRLAGMICLCVFMLAMTLAILYLLIVNENKADNPATEVLYFVFGLFALFTIFLCWLTWRYGRLFIRIEGKGLTASTYFGLRYAEWEDIIALRDWVPFRGFGYISDLFAADFTFYKIYSQNHMITFSSSLPGARELARLISEAAGRDWTHGGVA